MGAELLLRVHVRRAELMTGGGWCMYALANFERLVLGCINAVFRYQILSFQDFSRSTVAAIGGKEKCEHFSSPEQKEHLAEREDAQISAPARAP